MSSFSFSFLPICHTGLTLICDDMTTEKVEKRRFTFHKKNVRTIDLVRATVGKHSRLSQTDTSARATFSCPVMSRRHARVQFNDDGTVRIFENVECSI